MSNQQNRISPPERDSDAVAGMIALLVALAGLAVMVGWIFDISWLKSIRPDWVTMKFTTAFSFFFSGITLYYVSRLRFGHSTVAFAVLPASLLIITLTMVTFLVSAVLDIYVGIESLFVVETADAVETALPGRPSVGTMVTFLLIASAGFIAMFKPANLPRQLLTLGCLVFLAGLLAVLGYILDMPLLYYYVHGGISTAMALHTGILFICLGIGLIRLK